MLEKGVLRETARKDKGTKRANLVLSSNHVTECPAWINMYQLGLSQSARCKYLLGSPSGFESLLPLRLLHGMGTLRRIQWRKSGKTASNQPPLIAVQAYCHIWLPYSNGEPCCSITYPIRQDLLAFKVTNKIDLQTRTGVRDRVYRGSF